MFQNKYSGWTMPAEWEKHSATWMIWPHDATFWDVDLSKVQQDYARVAQTINQCEPLKLIVDPSAMSEAKQLCGESIQLIPMKVNTSWCRDTGPTFLHHPQLGIAGIHWQFNAWGNKCEHAFDKQIGKHVLNQLQYPCFSSPLVNEGGAFHVDGDGTLMTTESVLLNANRNKGMTKKEVEDSLKQFLGIEKIIWLPGDPDDVGGDITDGHIDGICAFSKPGQLLVECTRDIHSDYGKVVKENQRALTLARDAQGRSFELIPLYEAEEAIDFDCEHFCASYVNFYIANGAIIMPAYGVSTDLEAVKTLQAAFPSHQIKPVRINYIARGGGGIHCITQQQPALLS